MLDDLEQYRSALLLLARAQLARQRLADVDASDLVQETFLDAHRNFSRFQGVNEAQFVGWLRQILAAKLADKQREERRAELAAISGPQHQVSRAGQFIRAYVLAPYQKVKDERTQWETGNVEAVLDGDLDDFMEAWLRWRRASSRWKSSSLMTPPPTAAAPCCGSWPPPTRS